MEEFKVRETRPDGCHNFSVPQHVYERGCFLRWRAERTRLEKSNRVLPAGYSDEGLGWCECSREGVIGFCGPKERDCVSVVRERCEEKNSSVISATWGACTDPSAVGIGEAEVVALLEILEPTVDDCVDALVATRFGDKQASLTIIVCGRSVGRNKVLHTDVSPEGKLKGMIITMLQV